ATLIGVLAGQELMAALAWFLQLDKSVFISGLAWPPELWSVPALAVVVALLSALLPAYEAYRANVSELLQSR
ncbi:MAG: ABC transporter permease, partial [Polaromonas sp.]|nr:ABC transporter permease [Polaromonas sp.]